MVLIMNSWDNPQKLLFTQMYKTYRTTKTAFSKPHSAGIILLLVKGALEVVFEYATLLYLKPVITGITSVR